MTNSISYFDRMRSCVQLLGTLVLLMKSVSIGRWLYYTLAPHRALSEKYHSEGSKLWVLITGPTSGIGKGFAQALAAQGFNLLLVARNQEKVRALGAELSATHGIETAHIIINLEDFPSTKYSCADFSRDVKRVTLDGELCLLVCNAGMSDMAKHFSDISFERNRKMIHLNVIANVAIIQTLLPIMLLKKSAQQKPIGNPGIIVIGALTAMRPFPFLALSSGNKHFLHGFITAISAEFEEHLDIMLSHPVAVQSNICVNPDTFTAVPANTFARNTLSDFVKGRKTSFGSPFYGLFLMVWFSLVKSQWILNYFIRQRLDQWAVILNRKIDHTPISEKLKNSEHKEN